MLKSSISQNIYLHDDEVDREYRDDKENWDSNCRKRPSSNGVRNIYGNHLTPQCNPPVTPASTGYQKGSSFKTYSNCNTLICTPRTPLSVRMCLNMQFGRVCTFVSNRYTYQSINYFIQDITSETNTPKYRTPLRKQMNFNSSTHASGMKTLRNMR
uniref:Uncharacterized protein n=1 Tax=Corethron hystrix TaxID=216773 RepID=A0A7S1FR45_9STRA|mmetsp:Transcript_21175/g.48076  ORF Transcript_21175/g.48076 Transcript_21175/m.48076 type:complete len:156 (+) Transcript_21175:91-558(+)